jgi:hypothetical protein
MIVRRHIAVAILLSLGPLLGSCSGFSGYVADNWPHWAGGMPADVPPRPGAPGYNEFIAHGLDGPDSTTNSTTPDPSAIADKSTGGGAPITFQQVPAQTAAKDPAPKKRTASAAKKPAQNTRAATVPIAAPNNNQSAPDPSIGSGGLY